MNFDYFTQSKFFNQKKADGDKLKAYGFIKNNNGYFYKTDIAKKQLQMTVFVDKNSFVHTQVIDPGSGEEYVLHKAAGTVGAFVGTVRFDFEAVLQEISTECFEADIFKTTQAKALINYAKTVYGDKLEYLWQQFPENAVLRRKDSAKWYIALLTVSKRKLGINSDEIAEILDLREVPDKITDLIDNKKYFPGWHMNKKSWYTIILDGSVPLEEIKARIDISYRLAAK